MNGLYTHTFSTVAATAGGFATLIHAIDGNAWMVLIMAALTAANVALASRTTMRLTPPPKSEPRP